MMFPPAGSILIFFIFSFFWLFVPDRKNETDGLFDLGIAFRVIGNKEKVFQFPISVDIPSDSLLIWG